MTKVYFPTQYMRKHVLDILKLLGEYNQPLIIMTTTSSKPILEEQDPNSIDLSAMIGIFTYSAFCGKDGQFYVEVDDDVAVQFKLSIP